ncbi:hypothetical protein GP486_003340 [Trichoglossum hirsutum]|uniref:SCA7 domain-containing protein n=1 Tax=Trichoglossum hirsutum TaxID=265104 RepID=A0A9P8LD91_9PEZI|nr:hypothetical protein GP486_003340 [Trichoglossum hirsutum]
MSDGSLTSTIKVKTAAPKPKSPGNWKNTELVGGDSKTHPPAVVSPGPIVLPLDDKDRETFPTGQPLNDGPDYVLCKHCRNPFLRRVVSKHTKICLRQKQEKAKKKKSEKEAAAREKEAKERAKDGGDAETKDAPNGKAAGDDVEGLDKVKGAKKSAVKASAKSTEEGPKKSKKRKADGDAEKAPKAKKKKEEPKPKVPKHKGPVDVEKQCGVPLPNGGLCARSLTCKSHSMGSKRAVPGRSLPYDMLLQAYQKKNQAKQQKAAIDANAPLQDDLDTNAGPVDSDEEKESIMAAIARSRPQPLEQRILVPTRRKYQYVRMKEMLSNALGGTRGGGFFSGGDMGVGNIFSPLGSHGGGVEPNGQYEGQANRKQSFISQSLAGGQSRPAFNMQGPPQRKLPTASSTAQA